MISAASGMRSLVAYDGRGSITTTLKSSRRPSIASSAATAVAPIRMSRVFGLKTVSNTAVVPFPIVAQMQTDLALAGSDRAGLFYKRRIGAPCDQLQHRTAGRAAHELVVVLEVDIEPAHLPVACGLQAGLDDIGLIAARADISDDVRLLVDRDRRTRGAVAASRRSTNVASAKFRRSSSQVATVAKTSRTRGHPHAAVEIGQRIEPLERCERGHVWQRRRHAARRRACSRDATHRD